MEFLISNRKIIERGLMVRAPYILISIHDPGNSPVRLQRSDLRRGVLRLAFDDAEQHTEDGSSRPMSRRRARRLWAFVQRHLREVQAVVVQCEQGRRRSPAVAAALCHALGGDALRFFQIYEPNVHVFRQVLLAAGSFNDPPLCFDRKTGRSSANNGDNCCCNTVSWTRSRW